MRANRIPSALLTLLLALMIDGAIPVHARAQQAVRASVIPEQDLTQLPLADSTSYQVKFAVTNAGTERDVFYISCGSVGEIRCDEAYPSQIVLPAGETAWITVSVSTKGIGRGLLALVAFSPNTLTRVASEQLVLVNVERPRP